jgi:hypothetical protein
MADRNTNGNGYAMSTLTYSDCEALISTARNVSYGKPLENNTRLYRRGDSYAVQLHSTDVVTVKRDGTYDLSTGGWYTVTTKDRITSYSPANVHSVSGKSGPVWCVFHSSDPVTAPKVSKCRTCKGTGEVTDKGWTTAYGYLTTPSYEVTERYEYPGHDYSRGLRVVGQVVRHDTGTYGKLAVPVVHPDTVRTCYRCDGTGQRDYGSKSNPVRFYDGITVDSDGKVTDPGAPRLYDHLAGDDSNAVVLAAIRKYVAGLTDSKVSELWHYATTEGTAGDCWFCSMFAASGLETHDHLESHIGLGDDADESPYYMASLIMNALRARGYREPAIIFQMDADGRCDAATVRESVTRYLKKQLIKGRPTR